MRARRVARMLEGGPFSRDQEAAMPLVSSAATRRPPRVKTHLRRPAVARARLTGLNSRASRDQRAGRLSAARIDARSRVRLRATSHRLPLGMELVRVTMLVALAALAIIHVLPALLELAAAPFR